MPNQFLSPEGDLETFNYFVTEYWLIDQYVGDTLLAWGRGQSGQLGNNASTTRSTPVTTFAGGTNWKQVAAVKDYTAAIKIDGTLWTWGFNYAGILGDNTTTNRSTPVTTFAGGTNWKQVSCGWLITSAIKTDGTLWTWGFNNNGALGVNTSSTNRPTPVTTFAGGTNWKQVSCGGYYVAAIKTDGTLWTWGQNSYGKLGDNTTTQRNAPVTTFAGGTNWKQVSCGRHHAVAVKTDGTLWTWGRGTSGRLGDNTTTNRLTPVTTFAGGTNWKQVSCAYNHTSAIKTDGTLWTWGFNNQTGALGDNTTTNRLTPVTTFAGGTNWKQVSCGGKFTSAVKTDGTLWVWGSNPFYGEMGINSTSNSLTPVTTFAGGTNWKQVSSAYEHSVAVTSGTDPTFFIA